MLERHDLRGGTVQHVGLLAQAGYVDVRKDRLGRRPRTCARRSMPEPGAGARPVVSMRVAVAGAERLAVAGCGGSPSAPSARPRPVGSSTTAVPTLAAAQFGSGPAAVVLANMNPGSTCDWLPFARHLASWGFSVLCFDSPGGVDGDALAAAVDLLRRRGAVHVSLVGASHGAKASILAAANPHVQVNAVVTLTAESRLAGVPVARSPRSCAIRSSSLPPFRTPSAPARPPGICTPPRPPAPSACCY